VAFDFEKALRRRIDQHVELVELKNRRVRDASGVYERWENPVLTGAHTPLFWRYDLDRRRNPFLLERLGVHAVKGAGAIERGGRICLVARVEGKDRKSFFAVAESDTGVDGFRFRDEPLELPGLGEPEAGVGDMRLTSHEDGWIYGVFDVERKDEHAPPGDTSRAVAGVAIVRTHDLVRWERLADLRSRVVGPHGVVLHPELVRGQYAFYVRAPAASLAPEGASAASSGEGGIGLSLCENIEQAELGEASLIDARAHQTFKEARNSAGAPPLRTPRGWLHIAQGTRTTAAGLHSVLYAFLCDPEDPGQVIAAPGGYLLAATDDELVGDVASGLSCAGAVAKRSGELLIYYAASESRTQVASTTVDRLLDYVTRTPIDAGSSRASVAQRKAMIERNLKLLSRTKGKAYRGLR
jgi:4-O-beta-D-mannosyl-D-glucose phosphorylase